MRSPDPASSQPALHRGDLLPRLVSEIPGSTARSWAGRLATFEAPGINTLQGGAPPLLWAEALGSNVLDTDGNILIDLTAGFGVAAVGHRHPHVVAAIRHQSERLIHGLGDVHAHPGRVRLARRLVDLVPFEARVYFAISGADAVEVALKTASLASARPGVLAFSPAYHGVTLGALAVTSRTDFRAPFCARISDFVERLPYGSPATAVARALDLRPEIGACIVEPIIGREGVRLPPAGWLRELGEVCRRRGVVTIADEIFTGLGRAGELFVSLSEGLEPDLLCCGKALGGGLPIAAVIGRTDVLDVWPGTGEALHTATFVAHPLACAAALAALDVLENEQLLQRATQLGHRTAERLRPIAERYGVRGRGLLWGVEAPAAELAEQWARELLARGIVALAGGERGTVLQLVPPLVITEEQLDYSLDQLLDLTSSH